MLEKEQWPPNNSPDLNGMEISCLGNDARSYFETFIRSPKTISELKIALIWDSFPQVQLIKLSRVLQVVWQEHVNADGRHYKHFLYSKKVFVFTAFGLSWIQWLKWFCEAGGGSPDEARLEQTPYPFQPH